MVWCQEKRRLHQLDFGAQLRKDWAININTDDGGLRPSTHRTRVLGSATWGQEAHVQAVNSG